MFQIRIFYLEINKQREFKCTQCLQSSIQPDVTRGPEEARTVAVADTGPVHFRELHHASLNMAGLLQYCRLSMSAVSVLSSEYSRDRDYCRFSSCPTKLLIPKIAHAHCE